MDPDFQGDVYFNSGVLILDVRKFMAGGYREKLVELTLRLSDRLSCPDQDMLNIVFQGNFKQL